MYDSLVDIAKTAALMLAVLVPLVVAVFQYRREDRKTHAPATLDTASVLALGTGLAESRNAEVYFEKLDQLVASIVRLAEVEEDGTTVERARVRQFDRVVDELVAMRRALEEMSDVKRRRPGGDGR